MANSKDELLENMRQIIEKACTKNDPQSSIASTLKFLNLDADNAKDIGKIKEAAAKLMEHREVKISDLMKSPWIEKWSRISFGCAALDKCTGGGVLTRGITEICGPAGAGKTQILLQLSLTVQLPISLGGLGKSVAFIGTEGSFPSKRLLQMTKSFKHRYPQLDINFLGNIYIEHVLESDDLLKCVSQRLKSLVESSRLGMIIIDSVAAVFRVQSNYIERAKEMRKLANYLLHYSDKYNCAIVCVNQVATVSQSEREVPCLGLTWAHLGRTRYKISKLPKQVLVDQRLHTVRRFEILYAPDTPNEFAEFLISEQGVIDVPQS